MPRSLPGESKVLSQAFAVSLLVVASWTTDSVASTVFVDLNAPAEGDGTTWAHAFNDLASALDVASPGDEIWMARGVYLGTQVKVQGDLKLYGGFEGLFSSKYPGGETNLSQRDFVLNPTILSGDVLGDDIAFTNRSDNLKNVLTLIGNANGGSPLVDGLVVTGGFGYLDSSSPYSGALVIIGTGVSLVHCTITYNMTKNFGPCSDSAASCADGFPGAGIFFAANSDAIILDSVISDNKTGEGAVSIPSRYPDRGGAGGSGAGVYCEQASHATFERCEISRNVTGDGVPEGGPGGKGAGMYCAISSVVSLRNCLLSQNRTGRGGTSCRDGGNGGSGAGVFAEDGSVLTLEGCDFLENQAGPGANAFESCGGGGPGRGGSGGAIFSYARTQLLGCRILNNRAGDGGETQLIGAGGTGGDGGGVVLWSPAATISHTIIFGNSAGSGSLSGALNDGGYGGGLFLSTNADSIHIDNSLIAFNRAGHAGGIPLGKQGDGGGISDNSYLPYNSPLQIVNSTIYGNSAVGQGGGLFLRYKGGRIENCIFWNNLAGADSIPLFKQQIDSTASRLSRCLDGACPIILRHSCIEGLPHGFDPDGNTGSNPRLADENGSDNILGNSDDDFRLGLTSPCLNSGDNNALPSSETTDLLVSPRIHAGIVDMGCYENQASPLPVVLDTVFASSEANQVRISARFLRIEEQARALLYRNASPGDSGSILLSDVPLTPTSNVLELIDDTAPPLVTYWYSLKFLGADRGLLSYGPFQAAAGSPSPRVFLPKPNPFVSGTNIGFVVPAIGNGQSVSLAIEVYDIQGRKIRSLRHAPSNPGQYFETWDGRDSQGQLTAPGMYFVQLTIGGWKRTLSVVRLRGIE